jgi:hypothetical protein
MGLILFLSPIILFGLLMIGFELYYDFQIKKLELESLNKIKEK